MATFSLVSSSYEDIISKCFLIRPGSPAIYKLKPQKKNFGTFTRVTVGEKNPSTQNKTILLVGETGAGKSTLINALVNYTMGVKWEDDIWFQIVEESNQTESQTSDVIVYEMFGFEDKTLPYSLSLIDTPGFEDTRGIEYNGMVSDRLSELFQSTDGVHEVHVVGLVIKAKDNQLSDHLMKNFHSVMSLFGKDVEKNTVALITNSNGRKPTNHLTALEASNIKCAKNNSEPVYFLFDNCQHEDRTEEEEPLQYAYKISKKGTDGFTALLKETTPLRTKETSDVLKEGIRLTACIQNLEERIKFTEVKQREIKQTQEAQKKHEEAQKKHEEDMKFNEEFTAFDAMVYKHKELIKRSMCGPGLDAAVCCTVCEENCHYPGCTVPLSHYEVFKNGFCTSCTGKCPASDHVKETWRYVTRIRKVDKKEKSKTESDNLLENLEKKLKQLKAEKDLKLEEMRKRVDEETRAALQDRFSLMSSSYEDIISKSFLIHSGPPAVYQLRTKKENIGSLTRITVGEKNEAKPNKTILLVGETGAGKSTLINALINYTIGVKWEDEVWFQIIEEGSQKKSQTESQTPDVIVYEIFGFEDETLPYSLTIIDTPGFGDTKRGEKDDIISHRLLDLFRSDDGIIEINAVGLVIKASLNRLSDRLMYIFNSVMSLFGRNVARKIIALITHSDGVTPENALKALEAANIKCAKTKENQPVHFLFNNHQHQNRTKENEASLKHSWNVTQKEMSHLTKFLEKSKPQKMMTTLEVLNERIRLKACIQNLKERIELTELKQKEVTQTEDAVNQHKEEMENHQNFTIVVDEAYKFYEEIQTKWWYFLLGYDEAVCCKVCEENCHYPGCTMAKKPEECWVMKNSKCTACKNKCPASKHVKGKSKYVSKTRTVEKTMEDMKLKYDKNKKESEEKLSLLQNLKKEMDQLTAEKSQLLDESYQHVVRLEDIALLVDSASTIVHLDFLIEKMKEKGDTEKVQKLKEMKSRVDERTKEAYWYKIVQIPSAIKNFGKSLTWHK